MKSLLLTLVFLLTFLFSSEAQSCLPDGITFTTQGQIDSFPINYPGCTEIEGDVVINNGNYLNLDGLSSIKRFGGNLSIFGSFNNYSGLDGIVDVMGSIVINVSPVVDVFNLPSLETVAGNLIINHNFGVGVYPFDKLKHVGGGLQISATNGKIIGFNQLQSLLAGSSLSGTEIVGFNRLKNMWDVLNISLPSGGIIAAFDSLKNADLINITGSNFTDSKISLSGFGQLETCFELAFTNSEIDFKESSFESLYELILDLSLIYVKIDTLNFLPKLNRIGSLGFNISNSEIISLSGLSSLQEIKGSLRIYKCSDIKSLNGLDALKSIGSMSITYNPDLETLGGLEALVEIGGNVSEIKYNPKLSYCSIDAVCDKLFENNDLMLISNNYDKCLESGVVATSCGGKILLPKVELLEYSDCNSLPIIEIYSFNYTVETDGDLYNFGCQFGSPCFGYFKNNETLLVTISNQLFKNWKFCEDSIFVNTSLYLDTIPISFRLLPLGDCPELIIDLALPSFFRNCLLETPVSVSVQNIGTILAENSIASIVIPMVEMDVVSSNPSPAWTNGDTLFYALGDLDIFERADIDLIVKTKCDTFLLGQTLCVEAFATLDNPCDPDPPIGSIITIHPECIGDTLVEFTLTNIGDAPTMNDHDYFIIEDEVILKMAPFTLNPMQQMTVQVQADGSTFRMEATKFDDGTLTAAAIEGCGGLNPGLINAYWVDQGEAAYDMDCREVRLAYDPNEKSAVPTGVGPEHLMVANRPIQYTIDFQNTGTDTAYRVLIRDVLPAQLDVSSFRPLYATHDYTWQIYGNDTLEFLFQPIALPDSAASQEGSKGFVTFTIDQLPDLPNGTIIQNTADIVFDFNPPITTNVVTHTIGELLVQIATPTAGLASWTVWGNPMGESALFKGPAISEGAKQFELTDLSGRIIRTSTFLGNEFVFQRHGLAGGMYFFRITDERGGVCAGRIVVAE